MTTMPTSSRRVLISGASIAGPALAYWLHRYGFDVTVVEQARAVRSGGYPIDIRGTAVEVVQRMGLLPGVRAAHIASRDLTFVDGKGTVIATVPYYDFASSEDADVELPRGELTALIYGLTKSSKVCYRFDDSIETVEDVGNSVGVRFKSGDCERYDVVIGADGLHSNVRRLVFGPETSFNRYLGYDFNLFSLPNDVGLSHGAMVYAEAGRAAGVFAVRDNPELFAFLIVASDSPTFDARAARAEQIERTATIFVRDGWMVPRLIDGLRSADDLFFDTVSQIRMPCWSMGRVGLVGDAAYAPSFRSGQGTSLALVGAYVLAGELARHNDPADALAAYERIARPYVEANQALALKEHGNLLLPRNQAELDARNRMLESAHRSGLEVAESSRDAQSVHSAITLPDYSHRPLTQES